MSGPSNRNQRKRLRLLRTESRCHWCGVEVVEDGKETAANRATLDHVQDVIERNGRRTRCVLACYSCNKNRNVLATKARAGLPTEHLQRELQRRFAGGAA